MSDASDKSDPKTQPLMNKKTYGVNGYIEWVANIIVGGAAVKVPFTGGAITKYGIVPAEYTTSDPVIQKIIENSSHFRSRRIFLLKGEKEPEQEKKPETVKVTCLADATDILREKGVSTARITSREDAGRIGRENNIKFEGL